MKKIIVSLLVVMITLFAACTAKNGLEKDIETVNQETLEYEWQKIIKAEDSFGNCGFTHFVTDENGIYNFEAYGDNNLIWDVYVLDSEWDDADRFIPQANKKTFSTDGRLMIDKGKYVYVYCPHNDFTADAPLKGDYLKIYK